MFFNYSKIKWNLKFKVYSVWNRKKKKNSLQYSNNKITTKTKNKHCDIDYFSIYVILIYCGYTQMSSWHLG